MNKIFINGTIFFIKIYKYFFSPLLGNRCRFMPTCSDYFIECLNNHGFLKVISFVLKRIIKCHPIKILGGSSGLDLVPKKRNMKNGQ